MHRAIFSFFLFFSLFFTNPSPIFASDLDTIKTRFVNNLINVNFSDTAKAKAQQHLNTMNSEGAWPDIDYSNPDRVYREKQIYIHFERLHFISQYFRATSDNSALPKIILSLTYTSQLLTNYNQWVQDWWYFDIGIPNYYLAHTLAFLEPYVDPALFTTCANSLKEMADHPRSADSGHTGTNLMWRGMVMLKTGLIVNDVSYLAKAKDYLERSIIIATDNQQGLKPDFSYQYHGKLLHFGYGNNDPLMVYNYYTLTKDTSYQIDPGKLTILRNFALNGQRWIWYKDSVDISTIGREYSRYFNGNWRGGSIINSLLNSQEYPGDQEAEIVGTLKTFLSQTNQSKFDQSKVQRVTNSTHPAIVLNAYKHFPYSDFTIHRSADSYTSIKTTSTRTVGFESINNEGLKAWHMASGFTYITLTGQEYLQNNILPTLDWSHLPGTTVEQKTRIPTEGQLQFGQKEFVGGVEAGLSGLTAMDFQAYNSCLSAKKTWFFFDNEMVALGSDISCNSQNPVDTTINQWPISTDPQTPLTINGQSQPTNLGWDTTIQTNWAHHDNLGYFFPNGTAIRAKRIIQSGKWTDLNINGPSTQYSNPFITLQIDHGPNPTNQSYAYTILPNFTSNQTSQYANSNPLTILSQNNQAHAVYHRIQNSLGVAFWQPGTIRSITVDKPSLIFIKYQTNELQISASDPTNNSSVLQITIPGNYNFTSQPAGASLSHSGYNTTISLPLNHGFTTKVNLSASTSNPADFNQDGRVDLSDFAYWKAGFLTKQMDIRNFAIWKSEFLHK